MPPRVAVSKRRQQERARMRRHVQAVGDERDRAEEQAADDLRNPNHGTERDHNPGAAFVAIVACAKKDVRVIAREGVRHGGLACYRLQSVRSNKPEKKAKRTRRGGIDYRRWPRR